MPGAMPVTLNLMVPKSSVKDAKTTKELSVAHWLPSFSECPWYELIGNLIANVSVEALCKTR
jgi:hypothetical protein